MSESDIDPEDDRLIRGRPRPVEEDEWDDGDEGQATERDDPSERPKERDRLPDSSRSQALRPGRVTN
jgi:hypothetical protein